MTNQAISQISSSRGCIKVSLLEKRSWLMTWLIKSCWRQQNYSLNCKMHIGHVIGSLEWAVPPPCPPHTHTSCWRYTEKQATWRDKPLMPVNRFLFNTADLWYELVVFTIFEQVELRPKLNIVYLGHPE